jgi:mono/diheme cytochrome c family protein
LPPVARNPGFVRIALAAALPLLVAALAACGGGSGMGGMMHSGTTGAGGSRALFVGECGACHTLAAAGTSGTAGPDLDEVRPSYGRVVEIVTSGGSVMPAFAGSLSRSQIEAIARYVSGATG